MEHVQEIAYSGISFVPHAEFMSGERDAIPVISANTVDNILAFIAKLQQSITSLCVASGSHAIYSLIISTADARDEYDPDLVAALLKADAAPPAAVFDNVIDMMEWLERD